MMYETQSSAQTARLEDYIRAVRARLPLVIVSVLAVMAFGYWLTSTRAESYSATAVVALGPTPVLSNNPNSLTAPNLDLESEVLKGNAIAAAVVEELQVDVAPGVLLADLDVTFVPQSSVLQATFTGPDPEQAAQIINSFISVYVAQRENAAVTYYTDVITVIENQVAENQAVLDQQDAAVEAAQAARATFLTTADPDERALRIADIDAELQSLRNDQNQSVAKVRGVVQTLEDARFRLETRQPTADVIRFAEPPTSPDGIPASIITVGTGILGLIIGVVLAFVLERLDTTARDESSLALAIGSNVVAEIPSFGFGNRSGPASLVMLSEASTPKIQHSKEAFRRLRTSLQFLAPIEGADGCFVVAFTSAYPGEGKSTVVANAAVALAQGGKRVGVLSADLRRPTLEAIFGLQDESGLSDFLGSDAETPTVLTTAVPNLWLIPAGATPANPSELLSSDRFPELIKALRVDLDFVLIDTPPVLSTADALAVSSKTDGVLVVVDSRETGTEDLLKVRGEIERSGAHVLGGILNRDRRRRGSIFKRDRYSYHKLAS